MGETFSVERSSKMKSLFVSFFCILLLCPVAAVFAQQQDVTGGPQVLLDFSNLEKTDVDFSKFPGAMAEGFGELKVDMKIENWAVKLAPSSASPENRVLSYCRPVFSQKLESNVMGIRVHFPTAPFNSWAKIIPPFEIPFYEDAEGETGEGSKFINKGVLRNVGTVKSVSVRVVGRNYPHGFSISVKDEQDTVQEMFMGHLDFDGWRTLTWQNPNYITDVKQRDLVKKPLYPETMPSLKFDSFTVYRNGSQIGGDFVLYLKDVQMVYDLAILETERDINDEEVWGILQARKDAKRAAEVRRLGLLQLLRRQEEIKMQHSVTESQ
jgi:hypothetical protein